MLPFVPTGSQGYTQSSVARCHVELQAASLSLRTQYPGDTVTDTMRFLILVFVKPKCLVKVMVFDTVCPDGLCLFALSSRQTETRIQKRRPSCETGCLGHTCSVSLFNKQVSLSPHPCLNRHSHHHPPRRGFRDRGGWRLVPAQGWRCAAALPTSSPLAAMVLSTPRSRHVRRSPG